MLGNRQGECKSNEVIEVENTSIASNERANMFRHQFIQVERDGSFFTASEDEVIGVEHLLEEPKCSKDVIDGVLGVLGFETFSPQKCFNIQDFPCDIEYDQMRIDCDAMDSHHTQGEKSKLDFFDGMLEGSDGGVPHVTNNFSSTCEDYLLDNELIGKAPDFDDGPCEESCPGNLDSENNSLGFIESYCDAEISESCTASISVLESTYDHNTPLLDRMTIHELHEAFRNLFGRETSVKDKQWLKRRIQFGLQNLAELDNGMNPLECIDTTLVNEENMILSSGNESSRSGSSMFNGVHCDRIIPGDQDASRDQFSGCDSMKNFSAEVSEAGFSALDSVGKETLVKQKRLRKPTRRYIEETLVKKSRSYFKKCGISHASSKGKAGLIRPHKQKSQKAFGIAPTKCQEDIFAGACIQVPFDVPKRKGRPKKNTSILLHGNEGEVCKENRVMVSNENSDSEASPADSPDYSSEDDSITKVNTQKSGSRRKHHRVWDLSEVMKLIDGVSQFGVGRWTEIKRLLFPTSEHRTSVDLKDKWRNLLRASGAQVPGKREVEQGRKHATQPMPHSVLRRVRELALIYPYPRDRKSKLSCTPTSATKLMPLSTAVEG